MNSKKLNLKERIFNRLMTENEMEYKGYKGTVEFSNEDNCFYGKIAGIDDLVTFESQSVEELNIFFKEAVDDYLEDLGLLMFMQQADRTDTVSESEVMDALNKVK